MTLKLYHSTRARSMRPLWTLIEMGLPHELITMPFPPRVTTREYLKINPLGTIPCMVDGDVVMTESAGICQYLVERYGPSDLAVRGDEPDYGAYLNWLHRSDATLTFPQTLVLRLQLDLTCQAAARHALGGHKIQHMRLVAVGCWQQRQLGFIDHAVTSGATAATATLAQQAIDPRGQHRLQQGLSFFGRHLVRGALRSGDMDQQHFFSINRRTHLRP
jgi:hypothetical protein